MMAPGKTNIKEYVSDSWEDQGQYRKQCNYKANLVSCGSCFGSDVSHVTTDGVHSVACFSDEDRKDDRLFCHFLPYEVSMDM